MRTVLRNFSLTFIMTSPATFFVPVRGSENGIDKQMSIPYLWHLLSITALSHIFYGIEKRL